MLRPKLVRLDVFVLDCQLAKQCAINETLYPPAQISLSPRRITRLQSHLAAAAVHPDAVCRLRQFGAVRAVLSNTCALITGLCALLALMWTAYPCNAGAAGSECGCTVLPASSRAKRLMDRWFSRPLAPSASALAVQNSWHSFALTARTACGIATTCWNRLLVALA
jgi:hypothetical protein